MSICLRYINQANYNTLDTPQQVLYSGPLHIFMSTHIAKQIYHAILSAKRVLLVPHQNPDGDALGAVTAMAGFLSNLDKQFEIFCATDFAKNLSYLPQIDHVHTDAEIWEKPFDLIMVFDSGDLRYAGIQDYIDGLSYTPKIANIDHHITNEKYGTYNLVQTTASSTSEIVYQFFLINHVNIDHNIATSLLTGIITDTDNFTNSATSSKAIDAASKLIRMGAHFDIIKSHIYKSTPLAAFQLWGRIFSRLTKHEDLGIVYTYLKHDDLKEFDLADDDVAGMTNFLNAISDGHAGMILKEHPDGFVKGSFRTTRDDVDVSKMAQHFGGGGHRKAAGFKVDGPIEHAIDHVLAELEQLFGGNGILEPAEVIA